MQKISKALADRHTDQSGFIQRLWHASVLTPWLTVLLHSETGYSCDLVTPLSLCTQNTFQTAVWPVEGERKRDREPGREKQSVQERDTEWERVGETDSWESARLSFSSWGTCSPVKRHVSLHPTLRERNSHFLTHSGKTTMFCDYQPQDTL